MKKSARAACCVGQLGHTTPAWSSSAVNAALACSSATRAKSEAGAIVISSSGAVGAEVVQDERLWATRALRRRLRKEREQSAARVVSRRVPDAAARGFRTAPGKTCLDWHMSREAYDRRAVDVRNRGRAEPSSHPRSAASREPCSGRISSRSSGSRSRRCRSTYACSATLASSPPTSTVSGGSIV